MRRQLNEALKLIERDLSSALGRPKMSEVITAASYAPAFEEVVRVAPPSTGLALVLPEPNLARLDARVTVVQVAASGAMTVEVVNGTINGATTLAYLAGVGTVEFILTPEGWYGWSVSLVASFPLTGLAAQAANTIVANATGASAIPTAVAVSADSLLARVGGNLVSHPWSTVAGAGLTYSAGALAVGAGAGVTVNANDVAVTTPLTDGGKGDITVATNGTVWTIDALAVGSAKLAPDAVTQAKLADNSVEPANLVASILFGVPFVITQPMTAGAAGTADDVEIYNANAPFALRIIDVWALLNTAIVGSTIQLRSATGGGGSARSSVLSSAATGTVRNNDTATQQVGAAGSLYIRRSDRGVAGRVLILALRE